MVEILYNGRWGTICSNSWSASDAIVICRQLGFQTGTAHTWKQNNLTSSSPIWMSGVGCSGTEMYINECNIGALTDRSCSSSYGFAGVVCTSNQENGKVYLVI